MIVIRCAGARGFGAEHAMELGLEKTVLPECEANIGLAAPRVVVAIPVCNEEDRIAGCLDALAAQTGLDRSALGVLLFLNNCTDGTVDVVTNYAMPWPIRIVVRDDPNASAGWARRVAMDAAAAWLAENGHRDGVLLTTDADSCVGVDWVARNLAAIAQGADAVAGRIALDGADAALLPPQLHARGRLEAEYEALLTEIGARLDPEPGNPWPCHWSRSGATLAVRLPVYRQIGGMPDMPAGEDRAFVEAVLAHDLVVRHAPDIVVVTSGRLDGRARGGVADTIKLRCEIPDSYCDDRLERIDRFVGRVMWRRRLRRLSAQGRIGETSRWAPWLGIDSASAKEIARTAKGFGQAHAAIEAASPRLAYKPLRPSQLPRQIRRAKTLVAVLRVLNRQPTASAIFAGPSLEQPEPSLS